MTLQQGIKAFHDHLPDLIAHQGKWVLIDDECILISNTQEDAIRMGMAKHGKITDFFVFKIEADASSPPTWMGDRSNNGFH